MLPGKVLLSISELPRNLYRTLAFDVPDHSRYRILRRNAQTHLHVITHHVTFDNLRFLMPRQLVEYLPELPAQQPEYFLLPSLRNKHYVIFSVPSRVAQALVFFHREFPFSWQRSEIRADRRKGQTLVSPPAEPRAYLYELCGCSTNHGLR